MRKGSLQRSSITGLSVSDSSRVTKCQFFYSDNFLKSASIATICMLPLWNLIESLAVNYQKFVVQNIFLFFKFLTYVGSTL